MNETYPSPVGVGVLTVLTVLLVLVLAVFSVLTYAAAKADLALSERNAETVSAYYAADAEALRQKAYFLAGGEDEYTAFIPMTETQSLYLHLQRTGDGVCDILAWKTVPVDDGNPDPEEEKPLPVWDGNLSPLGGGEKK